MKVKAKINPNHLKYMKKICAEALVETAEAVRSDLVDSQTMPFDTGALQNRNGGVNRNGEKVKGTYIDTKDKDKGKVSIVSDAPYAERVYYHPELNFQKTHNKNAGAFWFEPYISGKKKKYATEAFKRILEEKLNKK